MSELKDLPNGIIVKILRFLDQRHLKNASLTCKRWNILIESSCLWSLKVDFNYYDKLELWSNFISATNRKFGTIELNRCDFSKDNLVSKIFEKHGINVLKLCIRTGCINNLITFAELLKLTPNLKFVYYRGITLSEESYLPPVDVLPELRMLKEMEIWYSDHRIIKCFGKTKITTIKFVESELSKDCGPMVDFLKSQDMLTSLAVHVRCRLTSTLIQMAKSNIVTPFQLTQLAISGITDSMSWKITLQFLKTQARSLQKLQILCGFPSSVYQFVFANLTKLNTLRVMTGLVPESSERLKQNFSIRTIILLNFDMVLVKRKRRQVVDFLKKLPNIHSLILPDCIEHDLVVAQSLSKLESLVINRIDGRSFQGAQFANLKTLEIHRLCGKINWNELTNAHSRLTELTINSIQDESFLDSDDIDQITTNVELQSIRLGIGFVADERFFEIIRVKCEKNLKVLDLHASCIPLGLKYNIDKKLLRLCDDIKCHKSFRLI